MDIILIIIGLVFLFFGGEGLLKGSVAIASRFGLSTLLVSMIIVGFGTSAPELMVCISAALQGAPDIALGNVVGSNIANVLLILGVAAVLTPVVCEGPEIRRDSMVVFLASLVLVVLAMNGHISRLSGVMMLLALIAYLSYSYFRERHDTKQEKQAREHLEKDVGAGEDMPMTKASLYCLVGFVLLPAGAHLLVEGATAVAQHFGISDAVIGLTLVALGTSLPELATAAVAAYHKHSDVVIGNIMGSNLFNALGILGTTAIILPIPFAGRVAEIDVWIMLAVAIILIPVIWVGREISRFSGAVFLSLYVIYIAWLYASSVGV